MKEQMNKLETDRGEKELNQRQPNNIQMTVRSTLVYKMNAFLLNEERKGAHCNNETAILKSFSPDTITVLHYPAAAGRQGTAPAVSLQRLH